MNHLDYPHDFYFLVLVFCFQETWFPDHVADLLVSSLLTGYSPPESAQQLDLMEKLLHHSQI